jgi:hypothetical protein
MDQNASHSQRRQLPAILRVFLVASVLFFGARALRAQEVPQGPQKPPPEHNVRRVGTEPTPPAPPALPPEEIIRRFSQKEDEFAAARPRYYYRKTIRLQEFGLDGKPSGELVITLEPKVGSDGKVYERVVERPQSTLQYLEMGPEDFQTLAKIPAYPLVTSQLPKYDLKYLGTERVDEIDCYIFQVKPKSVERSRAYFDGIIWADRQYLEVVKLYGKWVTDLGDMHTDTMPFSLFETYRENVDGKYWLPDYMRSDETLHLKDRSVPVRLVIKWTDFKPLAAASASPNATAAPQAAQKPPS